MLKPKGCLRGSVRTPKGQDQAEDLELPLEKTIRDTVGVG